MSTANGHAIQILPMEPGDIPQVAAIDLRSFPNPWSPNSYDYELTQNQASHFFVALDAGPEAAQPSEGWLTRLFRKSSTRYVVGYVGFWFIVDEVHISTIAVHPDWRGRGVGNQLLRTALRRALELGAAEATLEVRVSNHAAQNLYRKYGFENVGERKRYYRNGEDALLMTVNLDKARQARLIPVSE